MGGTIPSPPTDLLKHRLNVMRRVSVPVGFHVRTFGNPINARKIAKRKISVIPQIVLRTVVQHAAPD